MNELLSYRELIFAIHYHKWFYVTLVIMRYIVVDLKYDKLLTRKKGSRSNYTEIRYARKRYPDKNYKDECQAFILFFSEQLPSDMSMSSGVINKPRGYRNPILREKQRFVRGSLISIVWHWLNQLNFLNWQYVTSTISLPNCCSDNRSWQ